MADAQPISHSSSESPLTTNMDSEHIPSSASRGLSDILPRPASLSSEDAPALPNLQTAVGVNLLNLVDGLDQRGQSRHYHLQVPSLILPGVSKVLLDGHPVSTYKICGRSYSMEQPANETRSEFRRTTVEGRRLRYLLEVIQQPEKARACGAGPRSSADRRPVDPPPVVQLTVIDENTNMDITMDYDAGFMLYASLEVARPIAHGRMHGGPPMPVLTGVVVASTAYLDRPRKAGYFIFPDLSVRHEGWYRLKFSLFEALKHAEDADAERPFNSADPESKQVAAHESMANRMEVQSTPFQVFSAKKFPGLDMSTYLSRTVAEQGCRVRIRRDIRQRKRNEDKPAADTSDEGRASYGATPEASYVKPEHIRTASRNSVDSAYGVALSLRRTSIDSLYSKPAAQSRNPSIASLTMPSPMTPSIPQMMSMAPPSTFQPRLSMDLSPSSNSNGSHKSFDSKLYNHSSPSLPQLQSSNQSANSNVNLPPLSNIGFNSATRQYSPPESSASKRSHSSHSYYQDIALKSGARPDARVTPFHVMDSNGIIEADTGDGDGQHSDDELLSGDFTYPRADGTRGTKIAIPIYRR